MGRKKRRKRNQILESSSNEIDGLTTASKIAEKIDRLSTNSTMKRREDHDISLAAILSIQFWREISSEGCGDGNAAFCQLAKSLKVN
jgi:hypothetical protein